MGSPVLFTVYERCINLKRVVLVYLRHCKSLRRGIHTSDILNGSEHLNTAVGSSVSLKTLENLCAVVKRNSRRRKSDIAERYDSRVMPAHTVCPVHNKHVIRVVITESEIALVGLNLGSARSFKSDFHFINTSEN